MIDMTLASTLMPECPCVGDGNTSPVRASSTDGPGIDGGGLRDTRHARGLPRAGRGQTHSARPSRPRHEHVAYLDAPPSRLPRGHVALHRAGRSRIRGAPPSSRRADTWHSAEHTQRARPRPQPGRAVCAMVPRRCRSSASPGSASRGRRLRPRNPGPLEDPGFHVPDSSPRAWYRQKMPSLPGLCPKVKVGPRYPSSPVIAGTVACFGRRFLPANRRGLDPHKKGQTVRVVGRHLWRRDSRWGQRLAPRTIKGRRGRLFTLISFVFQSAPFCSSSPNPPSPPAAPLTPSTTASCFPQWPRRRAKGNRRRRRQRSKPWRRSG